MTTLVFETETCSRCSGAGTYSRAEINTCWRCGGKGRTLTRCGINSQRKYLAWLDQNAVVLVGDLKPGDTFRMRYGERFRRVQSIKPDLGNSRDGRVALWIETARINFGGLDATSKVYRPVTVEELRAVAPTLGRGATIQEG